MGFKTYFEGDVYDSDDDELVFPGGDYSVEWEDAGTMSDFDMNYRLEHTGSGFYLEADVRYDYSEVSPVIEDSSIESSREGFDDIGIDLFQKIWNDVRNGEKRRPF